MAQADVNAVAASGPATAAAGRASGMKRIQIVQVMSSAQHIGDLIIPCPAGHLETATSAPALVVIVSWTSSWSQVAQVMFTLMPQLLQE
jgi:hypothetical protein